ncbi:MAG: aldehyde dehydrogenase family protein [Chthoniobacter sp.]
MASFSMLHGSGAEIGVALVQHPYTRAAGFTGSRFAGRSLFNAAAGRPDPIPVFAEMSSLNPLFILPGALRERGAQIVEGLKNSVTLGVGQFCTKPGLVFGLGGTEFESFAENFATAIRVAAPATMLHPGICHSYHEGIAAMRKIPGVVALATSDTEPEPKQTRASRRSSPPMRKTSCNHPGLHEEVFGPYTLLVDARSFTDLLRVAHRLEGQLTATIHATAEDLANAADLLAILERKVGRLIINSFPTGVEVSPAMNHGGPYPATTDERFTSVGTAAIQRFARPVCYQSFPGSALPPELADANPRGLMRLVNGKLTRDALS